MTRSMGLSLFLMGASMAAAVASPGLLGPAAPWDCRAAVQPVAAHARPEAAPVAAALVGGLPGFEARCHDDPAVVYRHWHHGSAKLDTSCEPPI